MLGDDVAGGSPVRTVVQAAYTYAWWLTGDAEQACTLTLAEVGAAASRTPINLPRTLLGVRDRLREAPKLRPEAELTLLHDGLGLSVRQAAAIVGLPLAASEESLIVGRRSADPGGGRDPAKDWDLAPTVGGPQEVLEALFTDVPIEVHQQIATDTADGASPVPREARHPAGVALLPRVAVVCLALLLSMTILLVRRDALLGQAVQDDTLEQVLAQ